jgi:hypothetical protein
LVHEGGWRAERLPEGTLRFYRPDGSVLPAAPPAPAIGPQPVTALPAAQARLGITATTGRATWDGTPVDHDWGLSGLLGMRADG